MSVRSDWRKPLELLIAQVHRQGQNSVATPVLSMGALDTGFFTT